MWKTSVSSVSSAGPLPLFDRFLPSFDTPSNHYNGAGRSYLTLVTKKIPRRMPGACGALASQPREIRSRSWIISAVFTLSCACARSLSAGSRGSPSGGIPGAIRRSSASPTGWNTPPRTASFACRPRASGQKERPSTWSESAGLNCWRDLRAWVVSQKQKGFMLSPASGKRR